MESFNFKIKYTSKEMIKYEVAKVMLIMKILGKNKNGIKLITEESIVENRQASIYFDDIKNKKIRIFEIKSNVNPIWELHAEKDYRNLNTIFTDDIKLIIVDLNKCPDTLGEIDKWLEQYLI